MNRGNYDDPNCTGCGNTVTQCTCMQERTVAHHDDHSGPVCSVCGHTLSNCTCRDLTLDMNVSIGPPQFGPGPDEPVTADNLTSDGGLKLTDYFLTGLAEQFSKQLCRGTNQAGIVEAHTELIARVLRDRLGLAPVVLKFKLRQGARLPTKARAADAGIDLYTNTRLGVTIPPGGGYTFPTGLSAEVPPGYCILVWDRSSLGAKLIGKTAGVIDSEYRAEWFITLANHGTEPYTVAPGDKIAQVILTRVMDTDIRDVDHHPDETGVLAPSDRGAQGYGSSGR